MAHRVSADYTGGSGLDAKGPMRLFPALREVRSRKRLVVYEKRLASVLARIIGGGP